MPRIDKDKEPSLISSNAARTKTRDIKVAEDDDYHRPHREKDNTYSRRDKDREREKRDDRESRRDGRDERERRGRDDYYRAEGRHREKDSYLRGPDDYVHREKDRDRGRDKDRERETRGRRRDRDSDTRGVESPYSETEDSHHRYKPRVTKSRDEVETNLKGSQFGAGSRIRVTPDTSAELLKGKYGTEPQRRVPEETSEYPYETGEPRRDRDRDRGSRHERRHETSREGPRGGSDHRVSRGYGDEEPRGRYDDRGRYEDRSRHDDRGRYDDRDRGRYSGRHAERNGWEDSMDDGRRGGRESKRGGEWGGDFEERNSFDAKHDTWGGGRGADFGGGRGGDFRGGRGDDFRGGRGDDFRGGRGDDFEGGRGGRGGDFRGGRGGDFGGDDSFASRPNFGGFDSYNAFRETAGDYSGNIGGFFGGMDDLTSQVERIRIDWEGEELVPFVRDFYKPDPALLGMSEEMKRNCLEQDKITIIKGKAPNPVMLFHLAGFPEPFVEELKKKYNLPTPIQKQGWPVALSGYSMIGAAETGSGKTLAYLLPAIVHAMAQPPVQRGHGPIVLIMAPTRELVTQIYEEAKIYCSLPGLARQTRPAKLHGGLGPELGGRQAQALRDGIDILVACGGRLMDCLNRQYTNLKRVTYFVLDEADRMLEVEKGDSRTIAAIANLIRPDRQTLMWSATWPRSVRELAATVFRTKDYIHISVGADETKSVDTISHDFRFVTNDEARWQAFKEFVQPYPDRRIVVFCRTKRGADELMTRVSRELPSHKAECIHGDIPQTLRQKAVNNLRDGFTNILIGTDVLERGLDFPNLYGVVQYHMARTAEIFTHRVGRTGRAGQKGVALALVGAEDLQLLPEVEKVLERSGCEIPNSLRECQQGFGGYSSWTGGMNSGRFSRGYGGRGSFGGRDTYGMTSNRGSTEWGASHPRGNADAWGASDDAWGAGGNNPRETDSWGATAGQGKDDSWGASGNNDLNQGKIDDWGSNKGAGDQARNDGWGVSGNNRNQIKNDDWGSNENAFGKTDDWGSNKSGPEKPKNDGWGPPTSQGKTDEWCTNVRSDVPLKDDDWGVTGGSGNQAKATEWGPSQDDDWGASGNVSSQGAADEWGSNKISHSQPMADDWGASANSGNQGKRNPLKNEIDDSWGANGDLRHQGAADEWGSKKVLDAKSNDDDWGANTTIEDATVEDADKNDDAWGANAPIRNKDKNDNLGVVRTNEDVGVPDHFGVSDKADNYGGDEVADDTRKASENTSDSENADGGKADDWSPGGNADGKSAKDASADTIEPSVPC